MSLRQRSTKEWDNYLNGFKKLVVRQMPGLFKKHARIWAKAERLLERFGTISKSAEIEVARKAKEFLHSRDRAIDLEQIRGWKEISEGQILIQRDGSSNPVISEMNIRIYDDNGKRLVFFARYYAHCMGNPGYKLLKYKKGSWEKFLDKIWKSRCEKLRRDKRALVSRHGVISMMLLGK